MTKQKALVTGGAGFVGSELARRLLREGFEVWIVDNFSNGKRSNVPPEAKLIEADLSEDSCYEQLGKTTFNGGIFHLAAQASNAISFRKPFRDILDNQTATLKLLEYARATDSKRFYFTSSMSAYGAPKVFPTPESTPLQPDSPYGAHKAASEHYVNMYAKEYGFKTTIFRLYTTYGGGQNLENLDQGLLSIYLAYLVNKKPIVVKGSLDRKRDIVHVSDVVEAILLSTKTDLSFSKTYNMCFGEAYTIKEILHELIKQWGENPDTYPIEVQAGTPGDPFTTYGSNEPARRDLGWIPKISPLEGVCLTVDAVRKRR